MKVESFSLTTTDNKFDPNTNYDEWLAYERFTGSRCLKELGRFVYSSDSLSNKENILEINRAIDEIIKHDMRGIFKKVVTEVTLE